MGGVVAEDEITYKDKTNIKYKIQTQYLLGSCDVNYEKKQLCL